MKTQMIKITKLFFFFIISLLFLPVESWSENNNQQSEEFAELNELISVGEYVFEAKRVLPQSGSSKYLTTTYKLNIKDETAEARLPYYGVAYSNHRYGGNGGVRFDGEMKEYTKEVNEEKESILVKFKIRGDNNVRYSCSLNISKSGRARLHVIPNDGQSISYWGEVY